MKSAVFASIIASAVAFAPSSQNARASVAVNAFENELGAMAPLNYFDPLNICEDGDAAKFNRLREVEIKHGRAAMLAVVGYLTTEAGIRLPGMEGVGKGFAALDVTDLPFEVRGTIPLTLGCIGFLECFMRDVTGNAEFPGDYRNGFIDFGWDQQSDEWKMNKRTIELNQGRAAQMGILGLMVHEKLGENILP